MGSQLSHCGNAQACLDVNDTRMELCDSGEAPEERPRSALLYGRTQSHTSHATPDDRGGQARLSPRGPVGRNHSVYRSFGGSSPGTPRGAVSDADRMLEELRGMYSSSQSRPPADASSLAEIIVRDREMAKSNGGGDSRKIVHGISATNGVRDLRDLGHAEDALVRSALDVVAQRYANEGLMSSSRGNELPASMRSTPRHGSARERAASPEHLGPKVRVFSHFLPFAQFLLHLGS